MHGIQCVVGALVKLMAISAIKANARNRGTRNLNGLPSASRPVIVRSHDPDNYGVVFQIEIVSVTAALGPFLNLFLLSLRFNSERERSKEFKWSLTSGSLAENNLYFPVVRSE